jgi:parallel beta-helix repeat protein
MNRKIVLLLVATVLLGMFVVANGVKKTRASGTIYIESDGSINPATANITSADNVTYTFTDNINDSIVVYRSNIIIDGNGYTLNGTGIGQYTGINIEYVDPYADDNVTIQNVNIIGFDVGIGLVSTEGNKIFGCTITNTTNGIQFAEAVNNTISGNNITNNQNGLYLNTVFNTEFFDNNIVNNEYGVWLMASSDNKFYHNYFINNTNQVHFETTDGVPANTWDNGYPSGGNYWSDFKELYPEVEDIYSGPGQNETGSDGIWDGPYNMTENNIDNYPLIPEFPPALVIPLIMIPSLLVAIICRRKHVM